MKTGLFSRHLSLSARYRNPRKPYSLQYYTYYYGRADKDILSNSNSEENDMKRFAESSWSITSLQLL